MAKDGKDTSILAALKGPKSDAGVLLQSKSNSRLFERISWWKYAVACWWGLVHISRDFISSFRVFLHKEKYDSREIYEPARKCQVSDNNAIPLILLTNQPSFSWLSPLFSIDNHPFSSWLSSASLCSLLHFYNVEGMNCFTVMTVGNTRMKAQVRT